jgi:tetratricopeptide (TPR) repeat protein
MPTKPDDPDPASGLSPSADQRPPTVEIRNGQGVQAGDRNTQNNTFVVEAPLPAMESTAALPGLSRIPADIPLFVGRADELAQLGQALEGAGRAAVLAVHGLGGVGKSALAAQYVRLHAGKFGFCWWITADSPTAIDTGLAKLAVTLVPETAKLPMEQRSELGIRWLATHDGWLLVLDNVTSPEHASLLLERVQTGSVIMTSRTATGWGQMSKVRLGVLSPDEALELLTRTVRAERPDLAPGDLNDAERLCAELGCLPLAIEQAGAYIAQTRIAPDRYLELLQRYPARMFAATAEGGDAERTMARVWHVTLNRLADTPAAGVVLRILAWFAPDNIGRSLIEDTFKDFAVGLEVVHALGRLAAYNMITLTADTIGVHRLVQAVTRTSDPGDPHRRPEDIAWACNATAGVLVAALAGADPWHHSDQPRYQMVVPHVLALLDYTSPPSDTEYHCVLANEIGRYLRIQGNATVAVTLLARALDGHQRIHGLNHPDTLSIRNNLARAYEEVGDFDRAIRLFEATLASYEWVLGTDHPDTLRSLNNLAHVYLTAGQLGRAIPLFELSLASCERVLGGDHLYTLRTRTNLAVAFLSVGDAARAIPLLEVAIAETERVLGPEHPDLSAEQAKLAAAYKAVGDLGRAIPLFESTLAATEQTFGPDHPSTLQGRINLADAYIVGGDVDRAMPLCKSVLADCERVMSPGHPYFILSRRNLAAAHRAEGDLGQAVPLYEKALAEAKSVLGNDHPLTKSIHADVSDIRSGQ